MKSSSPIIFLGGSLNSVISFYLLLMALPQLMDLHPSITLAKLNLAGNFIEGIYIF